MNDFLFIHWGKCLGYRKLDVTSHNLLFSKSEARTINLVVTN